MNWRVQFNSARAIGFLLGPLLFVLLRFFMQPNGLTEAGAGVLGATLWIAVWWITEVVEVEVTALLPIVLFPLAGGMSLADTCASYGHKFIYLFFGGFVLAIAIQKWQLHKRIALNIIHRLGTKPAHIILGFMISTAFMSMWISNTATAVMMLPIALAVSRQFEHSPQSAQFTSALLLSIAYSASIGGIATLIGTPPNLILAGVVQEFYNIEISFLQWMQIGLPVSICLFIACWIYLTRPFRGAKALESDELPAIGIQLRQLGKMAYEEKLILIVFLATAFMWVTRSFLWMELFPGMDDTIIAVCAAFVLFLLPSRQGHQKLLEWKDAVKLPWGVLVLFGGGIAIAEAFQQSGLAEWIAANLSVLNGLNVLLVLLVVVFMVNFLTEITSNLATTSVLLPVLAPLAIALNMDPSSLMVGATLAASCAFMLPVATAPNAIVFASEHITMKQMMRTGLWLNFASVIIITFLVYVLIPMLFKGGFGG
ncbi:MAG: DASS family sodium-coupled anion symporter [Flavobacteriales bacterium]|nr:DASS family sodium-coupled anion symporter [Flavobacteriales bacterium]